MSFTSEASKLLTNQYFLYFIVFLSATNVLGYLVTNKLNAVFFFALVGLLTNHFSKNMAVVLLVSLIATNVLMSNKLMREGMDNATSNALEKVESKDPEIAENITVVKNSTSVEDAKAKKESTINELKNSMPESVDDINNPDLNAKSKEAGAPEGFGEKMTTKKGQTTEHFGPRLDYAATIEQSYQNLDSLLGSESIKQLTGDTQKLMQQQQNLFNTMNQMVPVLEGAQNMLKGFDMNSLTSSLKGMSNVATSPLASAPK